MTRPPISVCHLCPHRQTSCSGPCACTLDGRDIADHAAAGDCPDGRYPSRGLGDTVEKVLSATGIGPLAKAIIERTTGKPCDCPERQKRLNEAFPYDPPTGS